MSILPPVDLIIPCYNEESLLTESYRRLTAYLQTTHRHWNLIFVDDASTDATQQILLSFKTAAQSPDVSINIIRHSTNQGRGSAVKTGLRHSSSPVVGFIDIDLEISESYLMRFVQAIENKADGAIAARSYGFSISGISRLILSKGYSRLSRSILSIRSRDTEAGYKFFSQRAAQWIIQHTQHSGWFWDTEVVCLMERAGFSMVDIPVQFIRRYDKVSKVSPVRDSLEYIRHLYRFSKELKHVSNHTL